jgi:hypothetical protein
MPLRLPAAKASTYHAQPVVIDGVIDPSDLTLRMPKELVSPNRWNGRHWRVKHRLSQDWEQALGGGLLDAWAAQTEAKPNLYVATVAMMGPRWAVGYVAPRMRVAVTRACPSRRRFIRDDDNLRFCVKPLLDALRRQGYIRDDSRTWIDLPTPEQIVSADGGWWTIVRLTRV